MKKKTKKKKEQLYNINHNKTESWILKAHKAFNTGQFKVWRQQKGSVNPAGAYEMQAVHIKEVINSSFSKTKYKYNTLTPKCLIEKERMIVKAFVLIETPCAAEVTYITQLTKAMHSTHKCFEW